MMVVNLVPAGGSDPRWKDIADNTYAADYRARYSYSDAAVVLSYEELGPTFTGTLVADGLKPYFAYQMKFTASHDNPAMERLGYMGRWWWEGGPLNVSDAVYEANRDNPNISSFLVFDYFVTDANGHIEKDIYLDSTYHVLYRHHITGVPDARPPRPEDGPSIDTIVDPEIGDAYDVDYDPTLVGVYGEHEHTGGNSRPLPGELIMLAGGYELEFALTEESFHASGPLDGWWSTALMSPPDQPIRFSVGQEPIIPEPGTLALVLFGLAPLLARRRWRRR